MEEDHEVLDWGNEDDEQQYQQYSEHRVPRGSDFFETRRGSGDVDDTEDAVSLGGDDDEQDYYSYRRQESNGTSSISKSGSPAKSTTVAQQHENQQHPAPPLAQPSRDLKRENSSNSQKNLTGNSSSPQTTLSPQRSHSFSKITHALPPKPVVANVPFLHPSHPSIIEATAMSRSTPRDSKTKANGSIAVVGSSGKPSSVDISAASNADSPLPSDWEVRHPRAGGRGVYYYNVRTHQSTWTRPSTSSSSKEPASGAPDRRDSSSTTVMGRLTFDSSTDPAKSDPPQTSSTSLRSSRPSVNFEYTQSQLLQVVTSSTSATTILSYDDRHYRPPASGDITNATDKRDTESRYAPPHAFSPPPSPRHERFRSPSRSPIPLSPWPPQHDHDSARQSRTTQRPGRGQHVQLQADSSSQRDRDTRTYSQAPLGRQLDPPAVEVKLNNDAYPSSPNPRQQQRRQQQQQQQQQRQDVDVDRSFEPFGDRDRPMTRNTRGGHNQNREQPHNRSEQARTREPQGQSQIQSVSAPRHRSPPPHLRGHEYDYSAEGESLSNQAPASSSTIASTPTLVATTQTAPVHKQMQRATRFDRPAPPAPIIVPAPVPTTNNVDADDKDDFSHLQHLRSSRNHDVYVPSDITLAPFRRGERECDPEHDRHELMSSYQVGVGDANFPATNKRIRPSDERGGHPSLLPFESRLHMVRGAAADPSSRDTSSPSSEPQSQERGLVQSHRPGRKRQPLPPQSTSFHQMSGKPIVDQTHNLNQTHLPAADATLPPTLGDQHQQQQRSANNNSGTNSVPSGPRLQVQSYFPPQPGRDANHPDFSRSYRTPPSGPSGNPDRRSVLTSSSKEMRMDIDVENLPPPRIPSSSKNTNTDIPIRAGSGMYADREAVDLPRGPRAMASKVSVSTSGSMVGIVAPSPTSPTTPFGKYPGGPGVGGRIRERSPPPHLVGSGEGWNEYTEHRGGIRVGAGAAKREITSGWRGEEQPAQPSPGHHPMERSQGRREPHPRGRPMESSRSQQVAPSSKVSGTNVAPIGDKKYPPGVSSMPGPVRAVSPPSRHGSGAGPPPGLNMEPIRNNRGRGNSMREPSERPLPHNARVSNVDSYRPGLSEPPQSRYPNVGRTSSPPLKRDQPSPVDALPVLPPPPRGRRETPREQTRFDQSSSQELPRMSASHSWRARSLSPGRERVLRSSFSQESNLRVMSPRPLSRGPAPVSASWDTRSFVSDRGRQSTGQYFDNARQHRPDTLGGEVIDVEPRQRFQQDKLMERGREQYGSIVEPRHSGSLEGRLGDRYNDLYVESSQQPHGLPPIPSLRRDNDPPSSEPTRQKRPEARVRSRSFSPERVGSNWIEQGRPLSPDIPIHLHPSHGRILDETPDMSTSDRDVPLGRSSKPVRIRRPPSSHLSRQDEHVLPDSVVDNPPTHAHPRDRGDHVLDPVAAPQQRPSALRRGASLLDRLSLDQGGDSAAGSIPSPSLRERVQVPAKRDRDDMLNGGDRNSMDSPFDGEDGAGADPIAKRTRRRAGKPRRRRGAP